MVLALVAVFLAIVRPMQVEIRYLNQRVDGVESRVAADLEELGDALAGEIRSAEMRLADRLQAGNENGARAIAELDGRVGIFATQVTETIGSIYVELDRLASAGDE